MLGNVVVYSSCFLNPWIVPFKDNINWVGIELAYHSWNNNFNSSFMSVGTFPSRICCHVYHFVKFTGSISLSCETCARFRWQNRWFVSWTLSIRFTATSSLRVKNLHRHSLKVEVVYDIDAFPFTTTDDWYIVFAFSDWPFWNTSPFQSDSCLSLTRLP